MIKSINLIVDSVFEELSAFKITDDHPNIDPDYVKDKIVEINGSLMREEFQGTGVVNEQFYTPVECLEVDCLQTTCVINGITVTKKHPIYRVDMPYLQTGIGEKDVKYFGLNSWRKNFRRTDIIGLAFNEYRMWTPQHPAWALVGHEAFLINLPTTSTKRLSALVLYADPRKTPKWDDTTSIFPTPSPYKLAMLVFKEISRGLGMGLDILDDAQRARGIPQPQQQNDQSQ